MPKVAEFNGIVITMYRQEHEPPHFHARYGEHRAVFGIDPIRVFAGSLPARQHRMVVDWASLHRSDRQENWRRARSQDDFKRIAPRD